MIKKKFCQKNLLNAYVRFGMKKAVLTTIPKMIQRKNQKKLLGGAKKYKKLKFFAKLFF